MYSGKLHIVDIYNYVIVSFHGFNPFTKTLHHFQFAEIIIGENHFGIHQSISLNNINHLVFGLSCVPESIILPLIGITAK